MDWQSQDSVLIFLSRLYTDRQELECDRGLHGCSVNRDCNEDSIIAKPRHMKPHLGCKMTTMRIIFLNNQENKLEESSSLLSLLL